MLRILQAVVAAINLCAIGAPPIQAAPAQELKMQDFKKPPREELKKKLNDLQYRVTQEEATEPPFKNEYWDNKRDGIYVDVVSGEPLFSSTDKYDSGCGWPSFTKPIEDHLISTRIDRKLHTERVEIRSRYGDSHLGHVFNDGPGPTGLRYCLNSAAMRFIPAENLEKEGYGRYRYLFEKSPKKQPNGLETATLAGGCFWGMEEILRGIPGVVQTRVGYTGGETKNPTYNDVKKGNTGHAEAVEIVFDPKRISYEELLGYFFRMHDPTTLNRQGNDIGTQYRSAIFVQNEEQKKIAEKVVAQVTQSGKWKKPIVTQITQAKEFYSAEDFHQKYLVKNPGGYTCHFLRD